MKKQSSDLDIFSNHKKKGIIDNPEASYQTPRSHSSKGNNFPQQTKSILLSASSYHTGQCLCRQCLKQRRLYKMSSPSPLLSLSTTYKQQYPPNKSSRYQSSPHRPFSAQQSSSKLLLSSRSTYRDHYNQLNPDKLTRPRPKDLLSSSGPVMELSMYNQQFPGHRGKNQYVPVNPDLFRGGLSFQASTTYSKQFGKTNGRSSEKAKPPDQFRMGSSWLGESTYHDQFKNPQCHVSPHKAKTKINKQQKHHEGQTSSILKNPSSHFRTTYHSDFKSIDLAVSLLF